MHQLNFKLIFLPLSVIIAIGSYFVYTLSPDISNLFGYDDPNTYFFRYLITIFVGLGIFEIIRRLQYEQWFDRIGITIAISSFIFFLIMMFGSTSIAPFVDGKQYIVNIFGFSIVPIYYFSIAMLWFLVWANTKQFHLNYIIFGGIVFSALLMLYFNDISNFIAIELFFIAILFAYNKLNKVSIFGALFVVLLISSFIYSFYDINKFHFILSSDYVMNGEQGGFNKLIFLLGWGLFSISIIAYGLFLSLLYRIKENLFVKGIVLLITINIIMNLVSILFILPFTPPTLYLIEYSHSGIITFFIMLGMVMMQKDTINGKETKDEK